VECNNKTNCEQAAAKSIPKDFWHFRGFK